MGSTTNSASGRTIRTFWRSVSSVTLGTALLAASALSSVACSPSGMRAYTPVEEKTKFSGEALHLATRKTFEMSEHPIVLNDPGSGTITTRLKEIATSSVPRLSYRYSYKVGTQGGVLTIDTTCTQNSTMAPTEFTDCGADRPGRIGLEQTTLRDKILKRAAKIGDSVDETDWSEKPDEPEPEEKAADGSPDKKGDVADKKGDAQAKKAEGKGKAHGKSKGHAPNANASPVAKAAVSKGKK